jgi:ABC-type Zn uptake system ZnuABC Zn-binding protein ZnuA
MTNRPHKGFWGIAALLAVLGCGQKQESSQRPEISVTNTYLQSAVADLTGGQIPIFCLTPPGMCPGHFDLSPEQIQQLLGSRILFRFDFQGGLDDKLRRMDLQVVPIQARAGLCIPQTYLDTCRDLLNRLSAEFPEMANSFAKRFEALEASLLEVSAEIRSRVEEAGLKGQTVLASGHQVEFVRWLGLEAAAVFQGADSMTPSQIAQCLEAGRQAKVKIIIATLQEGAELPRRLAEQLNARLVVFSNFPDLATDAESRFVQMLQNNINALIP